VCVGRVIAVLRDRLFVVYVYMYYMLVRLSVWLSVCLNLIKGTIIIIIITQPICIIRVSIAVRSLTVKGCQSKRSKVNVIAR